VIAACAARSKTTPPPSPFPLATVWTVPLPALIEGPLATDGERLFVATRDGDVRALEITTGAESWKAVGRGGALGHGEGLLVARQADGTVWGLEPKSGSARWKASSGVVGTIPPVIDQGRVLVAGEGFASLGRGGGLPLWSVPTPPTVTTPPLPFGPWIFAGEADGTLRARDGATGVSLWAFPTSRALRAPMLVDDQRRLFVGTTSDSFIALNAARGRKQWRWKLGTDVQTAPVIVGGLVFFASHEAVLYALKRGNGHMVWRVSLPSRPLSGPILYGKTLLVACAESRLVGFDLTTGKRRGDLQVRVPGDEGTPVIRTPPLVLDNRLFVGVSNPPAVLGLELGAAPSPAPSPEAAPSPAEATPALPRPSPSPSPTPSPTPNPMGRLGSVGDAPATP